MFDFLNPKIKKVNELIKYLELPEFIYFGSLNLKYKFNTKELILSIYSSKKKGVVSDFIFDTILNSKRLETQEKFKTFYQNKIKQGDLIIWNNAVYYYGMSSDNFIREEVSLYLTDDFSKKYNMFYDLSNQSINLFIDKKIKIDKIEKFSIPERFYINNYFSNVFDASIEMFESIKEQYNIEIKYNDNFKKYNIKETNRENLKQKIKNFDDIIKTIDEKDHTIEIISKKKYCLSGLFDFNSILLNSIFLNLENLNEELWVQLVFIKGCENPKIQVFNFKYNRPANINELIGVEDLLEIYIV